MGFVGVVVTMGFSLWEFSCACVYECYFHLKWDSDNQNMLENSDLPVIWVNIQFVIITGFAMLGSAWCACLLHDS